MKSKRPPIPRNKAWYEGHTYIGADAAAAKHAHHKPEHKRNKRYARCPVPTRAQVRATQRMTRGKDKAQQRSRSHEQAELPRLPVYTHIL